jgi:hypothetical protein
VRFVCVRACVQLTAYGKLEPGELAMQQEILARGPIVCGIACPDDFTYHYHSSKNNGESRGAVAGRQAGRWRAHSARAGAACVHGRGRGRCRANVSPTAMLLPPPSCASPCALCVACRVV